MRRCHFATRRDSAVVPTVIGVRRIRFTRARVKIEPMYLLSVRARVYYMSQRQMVRSLVRLRAAACRAIRPKVRH